MSDAYPLEPVIHPVDTNSVDGLDKETEHVRAIDTRTGKIVPEGSWRVRPGVRRYYLVSTRHSAIAKVLNRLIKDITTEQSVNVNVEYEASCQPDNVIKVIEALYNDKIDNPGFVFEELIRRWIGDYADKVALSRTEFMNANDVALSRAEFMRRFYANGHQKKLEDYLRKQALEEVGLDLIVTAWLTPDNLDRFHIVSDFFPVTAKASSEELLFKFEAFLYVDKKHKENAIINYKRLPKLQDDIEKHLKHYLEHHVGLHDFVYHLKDTVKKRIIEELNTLLAPEGRYVTPAIKLESRYIFKKPELSMSLTYPVPCPVRDCPDPKIIVNELLLTLDDIGLLREEKIDDVKAWFKQTVERSVDTHLRGITIVDLELNLDTSAIKKEVGDKAEAIGYAVEHYFVLPESETRKLKKEGLHISIEEVEFATNEPAVPAKLSIFVSGKIDIDSMEKIKDYINCTTSIEEEIRKRIVVKVEYKLHSVRPDQFYFRFYETDEDHQDELPFEEQLKNLIRGVLQEKFGTKHEEITLKIHDTELMTRLKRLRSGSRPIDFEVDQLPGEGKFPSVTITGRFKVNTVHPDGWSAFVDNSFDSAEKELQEIEDVLVDSLRREIALDKRYVVEFYTKEGRRRLEKHCKPAKQEIIKQYGLDIDISNLHRKLTDIGKRNKEIRAKMIQDSLKAASTIRSDIQKQLEEDLETRRGLRAGNTKEDDERMIVINKRIEANETALSIADNDEPGQFKRALPSSSQPSDSPPPLPSHEEASEHDWHTEEDEDGTLEA